MTRGQWGCAVAPVAGLAIGVLGSVLLAAAWEACDVGVNGAANGLALIFYGTLLAITGAVWWGVLIDRGDRAARVGQQVTGGPDDLLGGDDDEFANELREHGEDVEDESAAGGGGVQVLVQRGEADAALAARRPC